MTTLLIRNNEIAIDSLLIPGTRVDTPGYVEKLYGKKFVKIRGAIVLTVGYNPTIIDVLKSNYLRVFVRELRRTDISLSKKSEYIHYILTNVLKTSPDFGFLLGNWHFIVATKSNIYNVEHSLTEDNRTELTITRVLDNITYEFGTGGSYAVGALRSGATVAEAVKIATELDPLSGGKVYYFNTLDLK